MPHLDAPAKSADTCGRTVLSRRLADSSTRRPFAANQCHERVIGPGVPKRHIRSTVNVSTKTTRRSAIVARLAASSNPSTGALSKGTRGKKVKRVSPSAEERHFLEISSIGSRIINQPLCQTGVRTSPTSFSLSPASSPFNPTAHPPGTGKESDGKNPPATPFSSY